MPSNSSETTTSDSGIDEAESVPKLKPGDGKTTCKICSKPLPPLAMMDRDPYCSTACCKSDHYLPWEQEGKKRAG